jgi:hypothetical protein
MMRQRTSRFTPLIDFLADQPAETVTLSFTEIEALIGRPLCLSATQSPASWVDASARRVRDLQAIGWRAHLNLKAHSVTFVRSDTAATPGADA